MDAISTRNLDGKGGRNISLRQDRRDLPRLLGGVMLNQQPVSSEGIQSNSGQQNSRQEDQQTLTPECGSFL